MRSLPEYEPMRGPKLVRLLVAVLTVWALASIVPDLGRLFEPLATIGVTAAFDGRITSVEAGGPAAAAGIVPWTLGREGDRIDFARTPRSALFELYGGLGGRPFLPQGREITLALVAPNGENRSASLTAVLRHPTLEEHVSLLLDELLGIGFVLLGASLAWHYPKRLDVFGFFLYSIWFNPGQDYVFYQLLPAPLRAPHEALAAFLQAAGLAGFALFSLRFPTNRSEGWRRPVERALPLFVIILTGLTIAGSGAAFGRPNGALWLVTFWTKAAVYPLVVAAFLTKLRILPPAERERLRWVIFGCIPGLFFFLLAESVEVTSLWQPLFERIHWSPPETLLDVAYLVNALVPLCIGYAVIRQRVLPVDFIVNRGLTLGIVWAIVAMSMEGTVLATHRFIEENHLVSTLVLATLLIVAAPLLERLKEAVNEFVDRFFFVQLHEAKRNLERDGRSMAMQTSVAFIETGLVEVPVRRLDLAYAALFTLAVDGSYRVTASVGRTIVRSFPADAALVQTLRRAPQDGAVRGVSPPPGDLPADAASAERIYVLPPYYYLEAFVVFGHHTNGVRLSPDEVEMLGHFVRDCGSARSHAQAVALRSELAHLRAALDLA